METKLEQTLNMEQTYKIGMHTVRILVGKSKREKELGIPNGTCRWEDNIKMDFKEWGVKVRTGNIKGLCPKNMHWSLLPQVRVQ
jgi:hypothetical protein